MGRGVLTRDANGQGVKERGPGTPVLEVMQADAPTVSARAKLDTARRSLMQKGRPVVGVTDSQERLIGVLTIENLGEITMVQTVRLKAPTDSGAIHAGDLRLRPRPLS